MRAIFFGTFPIALGLLARPPQWETVAVGAVLWLFGGLWVHYQRWEPGGQDGTD